MGPGSPFLANSEPCTPHEAPTVDELHRPRPLGLLSSLVQSGHNATPRHFGNAQRPFDENGPATEWT